MSLFLLGVNLILGKGGTPTGIPPVITYVPTYYLLGF